MKTIATLIAALLAATLFATSACATGARVTNTDTEPRYVVVVGDSITGGAGTIDPDRFAWPHQLGFDRSTTNGGCLVTVGCFGGASTGVETYERDVLAKNPDVVVIGFGINDVAAGVVTMREILGGMEEMAEKNAAMGIETYVATVTPIRGARWREYDDNRIRLNRLIRTTFGEQVIDFDRALIGWNGKLPRRYDSGDHLHPNARAYRAMARVAADALR